MIVEWLQRHASERPDAAFLSDTSSTLSFGAVASQARQMAGRLAVAGVGAETPVYFYANDSARLVTAVLATQYLGAHVCVLNRSFGREELASFRSRLRPGVLVTDDRGVNDRSPDALYLEEIASATVIRERFPDAGRGGIIVLTTGTTGTPKAVLHDWSRLLAQVRAIDSPAGRTWALLYPLNHFAGLQVLLHAAKNGLALTIPRSRSFSDVLECMIRGRVDCVSATPTFWRMFTGQLGAAAAQQLWLRQITLGGEPVTADILLRLKQLFPNARITQVFATTEIGSCFAVSDGMPGFPAEYLNRTIGAVTLTIRDGQLYVQTPAAMVGYVDGSRAPERDGEWIPTGDLVEVRGDRAHFLGRIGEIINVGGVKVSPPTVEERIRQVDGVRDVRVYGKPNPVTGQIVAADVEIMDGFSPESVIAAIRQSCRAALSRYEQPRELRVVAELMRSNEKLVRR